MSSASSALQTLPLPRPPRLPRPLRFSPFPFCVLCALCALCASDTSPSASLCDSDKNPLFCPTNFPVCANTHTAKTSSFRVPRDSVPSSFRVPPRPPRPPRFRQTHNPANPVIPKIPVQTKIQQILI